MPTQKSATARFAKKKLVIERSRRDKVTTRITRRLPAKKETVEMSGFWRWKIMRIFVTLSRITNELLSPLVIRRALHSTWGRKWDFVINLVSSAWKLPLSLKFAPFLFGLATRQWIPRSVQSFILLALRNNFLTNIIPFCDQIARWCGLLSSQGQTSNCLTLEKDFILKFQKVFIWKILWIFLLPITLRNFAYSCRKFSLTMRQNFPRNERGENLVWESGKHSNLHLSAYRSGMFIDFEFELLWKSLSCLVALEGLVFRAITFNLFLNFCQEIISKWTSKPQGMLKANDVYLCQGFSCEIYFDPTTFLHASQQTWYALTVPSHRHRANKCVRDKFGIVYDGGFTFCITQQSEFIFLGES